MVYVFTFILGVCLLFLFPIGTIFGVLILWGTFAVGKEDIDDYTKKKTTAKGDKEIKLKFSDYNSALNNNPTSQDAKEKLHIVQKTIDKYFITKKSDKITHDEILKKYLESLEKQYEKHLRSENSYSEDNFFEDFRNNCEIKTPPNLHGLSLQNIITSPSIYKDVCDYLNHECIDELIEDWEEYISNENYEENKKIEETNFKREQIKFIKQKLIEVDNQKLKKDEIIDKVRKDFYKKYNYFPESIIKLRGNYIIKLEFLDEEEILKKEQIQT